MADPKPADDEVQRLSELGRDREAADLAIEELRQDDDSDANVRPARRSTCP